MDYNAATLDANGLKHIQEIAYTRSLTIVKGKVIVIDELQELTEKAMKILLKILEKPINNLYYILGTMDESKIHKALLSRTVKYTLWGLSIEEISECLLRICNQEEINVDGEIINDVIKKIAKISEGSARTAISHLERVVMSNLWDSNDLMSDLGIDMSLFHEEHGSVLNLKY